MCEVPLPPSSFAVFGTETLGIELYFLVLEVANDVTTTVIGNLVRGSMILQ